MIRKASSTSLCVVGMLAILLGSRSPLAAGVDSTTNRGLECQVREDAVLLSWNIVFIRPIDAWVIARDGEAIARLGSDEASFVDRDVSRGDHVYELVAVDGDQRSVLGRCAVLVGEFGLRCQTVGLTVHIEWEPLLIDIAVDAFLVRQNGRVIARVEPDATRCAHIAPGPGVYRYEVSALSGGSEFPVGACTVGVRNPQLRCAVDGPVVQLDWSGIAFPEIVHHFEIWRGRTLVGRTTSSRFEDRPGTGVHEYRVIVVMGRCAVAVDVGDVLPALPPEDGTLDDALRAALCGRALVGACTVVVDGDQVPPPENLRCDEFGLQADDVLGDESLVGPNDVLLSWTSPVRYDSIFITRGFEEAWLLPGSARWFVDRDVAPGTYTYGVFGIRDGLVSRGATCVVTIPRPPVEPPADLSCVYVGPGATDVGPDVLPPEIAPFVQLRWRNGQRYERIVILAGGALLTVLPGDATSHRHIAPPSGRIRYEVFGVVGVRRSRSAICDVLVPVGEVPPVEDLRCVAVYPLPIDVVDGVDEIRPAPQPDAGADLAADGVVVGPDVVVAPAPVPAVRVILSWTLPRLAGYDRIVVLRNQLIVATLPGLATRFVDTPPFESLALTYTVIGLVGNRRSPPESCDVSIDPPLLPPPVSFRCELDPRIGAPIQVVRIQWRNPAPYRLLVLSRDGEILERLAGDTVEFLDRDPSPGRHIYSLFGVAADGRRSRAVSCEILVPGDVPPVDDLTCVVVDTNAQGATAVLEWTVSVRAYTAIWVIKDGDIVIELPGSATRFVDTNLAPGVYSYEVLAWIGERRSEGRFCRVVVEGPPPRDLLYFSSGLFDLDADGAARLADRPGAVTCLASHSRALQGWSFGVAHAAEIVPVDATIEGTATESVRDGMGPEFISIDRHTGGVTMAVVIDISNSTATLPPSSRDSILRLVYEPTDAAEPGVRYPVRYVDDLGAPPVAIIYIANGFEARPRTAPGYVVFFESRPRFVRGDFNGSREIEMADGVLELRYLFNGGSAPPCLEAADANASAQIDVGDPIWIFNWLYAGGRPPPAPFPDCGVAERYIFGCEETRCPSPVL